MSGACKVTVEHFDLCESVKICVKSIRLKYLIGLPERSRVTGWKSCEAPWHYGAEICFDIG